MNFRTLIFGALAPLAVGLACGGIHQDEIDCEEAVSYLEQCCPGFDANAIGCESSTTTVSDGCNSTTTTTYPAFTPGEESCIRSESCEALIASGVCGRAQMARETIVTMTNDDTGGRTTSTGTQDGGGVCR